MSANAEAQQPTFTEEERKSIRRAAMAVWNEISYDVIGEPGLARISREEVVELVCDAGRLESMLKRLKKNELAEKIARLDTSVYDLVRPAFPYATYS